MQRSKLTRKWIAFAVLALLMAGCARFTGSGASAASLSGNQTAFVQRGNLTAVIGATGTVRSNQSALVSWQTSGKVGEVKARLGQAVQADEELASLASDSLSQNIIQAQADLINAQNALDDLYEPAQELEIAQAEAAIQQAKDDLDALLNPSETAIAQAELAVIEAQDTLDDAQRAVDRLKYGRGSQEQIEAARASYLLAQDKVDLMQEKYEGTPGDPTEDAGKALALSNLAAAKTERDRALANLNWYLGKPSEAEIAEKNTQLALAKARLADAQEKLDTLKNPSSTDIALARARLADAEEKLAKLKEGPTSDEITVAQTRLTLAQATLNQARLKAPFAGIITEVQVMPGDMVSNGRTAFRIDDLSKLFVDLQVSEIDMHLIEAGQPVSVTFDAIPDAAYAGVVTDIGLVGSLEQGAVYFPVTVQLINPDQAVKPGMTAVANVVVAQVENVLQVPNRAIQSEDGRRYVYVRRGEQFVTITVKVGLASDTMSEVISDELKDGDEVLVSIPSAFRPGQMMSGGNSQQP